MNRIEKMFRMRAKPLFMPFLNAGDPSLEMSAHLMSALLESGTADILEIGIPYSDPIADGPTIQSSAARALDAHFRLPDVFSLVSLLRQRHHQPLILFTYFNPVFQYGVQRFLADAVTAGADGLIIPDLPLEESGSIRDLADEAGLALIPLVAPTTSHARMEAIVDGARGFIYCVSTLGVTGARDELDAGVYTLIQTLKQMTNLPVVVGFGISDPSHVKQLSPVVDGVIVGSALIRKVEEALQQSSGTGGDIVQTVSEFAHLLAQAR